ncbi:hypothetical protein F4818DRAFT_284763 [Hypoxylon cercidicola]|nr:hypothetical protein F4818DRAFT_284763 [Hypoxylon cercidicola]
MAARSVKERRFLAPPETDNTTDADTEADILDDGRRKRRKRDANVYDAVAGSWFLAPAPQQPVVHRTFASSPEKDLYCLLTWLIGRVTTTRRLDDGSESEVPIHHYRTSRDHYRDPILAPEEVLFRRIGAPVRYAEKDIYQAHEELRDSGRGVLPDSDMLKAIHSYSSHFYTALAARRDEAAVRNVDERSMDETALLAFGILLEETGREVLGRRGDLVFTEGVEVDQDAEPGDDAEIVGFKAPVTGKL